MPGLGPSTVIPTLEGPYRPNRALDRAARLFECPAPDNLVWQDGHLLFTSGPAVLLLDGLHGHLPDYGREAEEILRFESAVTAMAAANDGSLAIGLGAEGIAIVGGEHDGKIIGTIAGAAGKVATALCFADPHTLFACVDVVASKATGRPEGSLWRVDLRGAEPLCLAGDLASPRGLLLRDIDTLVVTEAGRRRLVACATGRRSAPRVLLDGLPGSPGRVARGSGHSLWLAIPGIGSSALAYGLVVRLTADCAPEASLHGGERSRGAVSCLEVRGELVVACQADGALVSVDLSHTAEDQVISES